MTKAPLDHNLCKSFTPYLYTTPRHTLVLPSKLHGIFVDVKREKNKED